MQEAQEFVLRERRTWLRSSTLRLNGALHHGEAICGRSRSEPHHRRLRDIPVRCR
jgi:hypothetical protein